jgi:hypothetical protein
LFILVLEALIFAYWFYKLSLFNVEENYGQTHYGMGAWEILIYSVCVLTIFSGSLTALILGLFKTAGSMNINQRTICEGPFILNLYSPDYLQEAKRDKIQAVLEMARYAVESRVANEGRIWVEAAALVPEEEEVSIIYPNSSNSFFVSIYFRPSELYQVEDGEGKILFDSSGYSIDTPLMLIVNGEPITLQSGESFSLKSGDRILTVSGNYSAVTVVEGRINVRRFVEIELEKGDVLIQERGNDLALTDGKAIAWADGGASFLLHDDVYNACLQLKYFLANKKLDIKNNPLTQSDPLWFYRFIYLHILLVVLGTLFSVVLRHSYLEVTGNVISFVVIQLVPFIFLFTYLSSYLLSKSFLGLDESSSPDLSFFIQNMLGDKTSFNEINGLIWIITTVVFFLIQTRRLSGTLRMKSYKQAAFLRLISLPVETAIILFYILLVVLPINYKEVIEIFPIIFLLYLLYSPIQKKSLIHLISLPKG